jgi:hypothetical protein
VKVKVREEHLQHPTVAFPPAHLTLGVLGLKMWQRPEQPVTPERHRNPLAEQERARWREGSQLACEVQQRGPETLVVHAVDRAGAIHARCLEVLRRVPGARVACIIRAPCH